MEVQDPIRKLFGKASTLQNQFKVNDFYVVIFSSEHLQIIKFLLGIC